MRTIHPSGRAIHIEGARHHNLKNLTLDIPRDRLVVVCGPSGSGKSTLAFDIVYAEGQRRYVESLSAYARQFLPQMDKPQVDKVEGLSPAISLEQQTATRNPRSTVGTVTEVYDFLRVFFARLGRFHCPSCGRPIAAQTSDRIVDEARSSCSWPRWCSTRRARTRSFSPGSNARAFPACAWAAR